MAPGSAKTWKLAYIRRFGRLDRPLRESRWGVSRFSPLSILSATFGKGKQLRFLMLGLDAAGKTTILYMLKLGEVVTTIPTIGFNVETVNHKHTAITVWDVGGPDKVDN